MRHEPQAATHSASLRNRGQYRSLRQYPYPYCRLILAATLFAVALSISHRPHVSRFQWVAAFLTFYPSFESCLINRQVEDLRPAEQWPERFHHLCRSRKDNVVHGFRLALASVCVEIDPASIGTEHEHPFLWQWIVWRH